MSPNNILLTGSSSQRKGENVMKTLISIFALTLAFAFTVPAFAGDVTAAKKAEEQCQKDGGNWDAKSKMCSGKY
jgi:hypothetical protein